jgi:hypothetical protein
MNQRHRAVFRERAAWAIFSPIKAILLSRNRFSLSLYCKTTVPIIPGWIAQ